MVKRVTIILLPAGLLFYLISQELMIILYSDKFKDSVEPFRIYMLMLPARVAYFGMLFQAAGKTRLVLYRAIITLSLNTIITYFLVRKFGMAGAAWGTVLATLLECTILFIHFVWAKSNKSLNTRKVPKSLDGIRRLWSSGIPAGIQGAVDVLSWGVLVAALISYYGEEALAAGTILMRCMQLTFMPAEGVATVVLTLVANAVGRGSHEMAHAHVRTCFRINSIFMLSAGIVLYVFREPIVSMFTDQPEVISIACGGMLFVSLSQWFDSMNITYLHALQGTGDTKWTSVANVLLSVLILGIGGAIAVSHFREKGPLVIWALALIYISCQGILFWMRWRSEAWLKIRLRKPLREPLQ